MNSSQAAASDQVSNFVIFNFGSKFWYLYIKNMVKDPIFSLRLTKDGEFYICIKVSLTSHKSSLKNLSYEIYAMNFVDYYNIVL